MKRTRFTEEQITYALRQVESGTPPADVCRQLGCSEASFYIWKKRYGNLGMIEVKELLRIPAMADTSTGDGGQRRSVAMQEGRLFIRLSGMLQGRALFAHGLS